MVEIKELVVRASFNQQPVSAAANASNTEDANCAEDDTVEGANEDIIEACVRQVLAILERQRDR